MIIKKGDKVMLLLIVRGDGTVEQVLIDACSGVPITCDIDCNELINCDEFVLIGAADILVDDTAAGVTAPEGTNKMELQYIDQFAPITPEHNHVVFSTIDGSVPSASVGRVHTHLGTYTVEGRELVEQYKQVSGNGRTIRVRTEFYV